MAKAAQWPSLNLDTKQLHISFYRCIVILGVMECEISRLMSCLCHNFDGPRRRGRRYCCQNGSGRGQEGRARAPGLAKGIEKPTTNPIRGVMFFCLLVVVCVLFVFWFFFSSFLF